MAPRSLQNRLLLGFFVSMTAILTLGGFVIYKVIEKHLAAENDVFVRERLAYIESSLRLRLDEGLSIPFYHYNVPREKELMTPAQIPDLYQAWVAETGKPIPQPRIVPKGTTAKPRPELPRPVIKGDEVVYLDYVLEDGRKTRLCSRIFVPAHDPSIEPVKVQVIAGRDLSALEGTLRKVRWFLIEMGAAVMGAVLIASRLIIRRGVKPVRSLSHQIEVMPPAEEGARFALPGAPTELQPVVGRLNALMDRVGAAIDHERQFANNAAHELRNPLAAIRSRIEVALSRTRKAEEYEEALENIWQSQQGMQRVVDHLLLLARLESGHRQSEFISEPAQLGRMLKRAWRGCIDNADERHLRISWHVEDAETEFLAPVSLLDIVFSNLLCNAANYTPSGGEVRIHAALKDGHCLVDVENTNPGLSGDMLEQTFTPFWRADPNASGHRGNAGIGLALCRRIAITLGGTITATLTEGGMVRYSIRFPVTIPAAKKPSVEPAAAGA